MQTSRTSLFSATTLFVSVVHKMPFYPPPLPRPPVRQTCYRTGGGLVGSGSGVIPGYKRERAMIGKAIARSIPPITARISAHTQIAPNATNARKINNNVSMLDSFLLLSDVSVQQTPPEFFVSYISS